MALELGMDAVEFDVRPTLDEVLVLMHDSTVDRTTDGSGEVSEMTLEQIRALKVVSTHDGIPDQPVPTFAEGLEAMSGRALINVDAKTDRFDLIAADIAAAGMEKWCFVQVDGVGEAEEMRAADPTIPIMPDGADAATVESFQALNPELFEFNEQVIDTDAVDAAVALDIRPTADALGAQDAAALVHEANGDDFCVAFAPMIGMGITLIQTDVPHLLAPCLAPLNAAAGYSGPE
jgi:glycerophosphoryl diester phosphodiesterase